MTVIEQRQQELMQKVQIAAGQMKLVCGVANNAAWAVTLDAMGHIRQHPRYKQMVKRRFKEAMDAFRAYESATLPRPGCALLRCGRYVARDAQEVQQHHRSRLL